MAQLCLYLLTASHHFPAQLIQLSPPQRALHIQHGTFKIIDLDLSKSDRLTTRLQRLRERQEDIEPNIDYELEQYAQRIGRRVTFNREARDRFLRFAVSSEAVWHGNFRDLNGAMTRMATLATGGRITVDVVDEEIGRLRAAWQTVALEADEAFVHRVLGVEAADALDRFDRLQLAGVLRLCRQARTLSDAGRLLFAASRQQSKTTNDADRLRKYLARFGLDWSQLQALFDTSQES